MLSILSQKVPRTNTASVNPIFYEDGRASQKFFDPSAKYMVSHTIPATTAQHGRSFSNPPLHFHVYQTELFHVVSGTARFSLDGKTYVRNSGETQFIPKGAFHCFENNSTTGEDLIVEFRLDKQDWEMEERFFRNFFGYLDDCRKSKQSPNPFQVFRFLHGGNVALAIPLPGSAWVRRQVSLAFMVVMGLVIGEWLFGYKASYEEYYDDRKAK